MTFMVLAVLTTNVLCMVTKAFQKFSKVPEKTGVVLSEDFLLLVCVHTCAGIYRGISVTNVTYCQQVMPVLS